MSEDIFHILKMGKFRPRYYRDKISEWFTNVHEHDIVWHKYGTGPTSTEFDKLFVYEHKYNHYWARTHFIRMDVYYDNQYEHSIIELSIHDEDINKAIIDHDWDIRIIQSIDCFDDYAFTLFTEIYDEMNKSCIGVFHQLEDYG